MAPDDDRRRRDRRADHQQSGFQEPLRPTASLPQQQPAMMQAVTTSGQYESNPQPTYGYGFTQSFQSGIESQPGGYGRNMPRSSHHPPYEQEMQEIMYNVPHSNSGYQYGLYATGGAGPRQMVPAGSSVVQQSFHTPLSGGGHQTTGLGMLAQAGALEQGQYYPQQQSSQGQYLPVGQPYANAEYTPQYNPQFSPTTAVSTPASATSQRSQLFGPYYQVLRHTLESLQSGRLNDAAIGLLSMCQELLGNVQHLGLVFDDASQREFRLKLWDNFNNTWLAVLTRQREVSQAELTARSGEEGGTTETHRDYIPHALLKRLGDELVEWCNKVDEWGLVDYQMGVLEEDIMDLLIPCRDIVVQISGAGSSGSASATPRGSAPVTAPTSSSATTSGTASLASGSPHPSARRR